MAAVSVDGAATELLACVCAALEDSGRPTCSCHKTVGPPVIALCCECEPGRSGETTIHFQRMYDADPQTLAEATARVQSCRRGTVAADFRIVTTRCYPTINARGEPPLPEEIEAAAEGVHQDVITIWRALACCPDVRVSIRDISVLSDPEGGCSDLVADVTAEVSTAPVSESPL